jgi:hypothetical protein
MTNPSASKVSGAAVLVIALAALVLAIPPVAAARTAPPTAVQLALSTARAQFHTQHVDADFSLLSRRDPRWALVDGTATSRNRLWATWLHGDSKGNWQLRYFDTTAPFQPQSTKHGRVPCDLYPAFSEALCPPSGLSAAQIRSEVFKQLAPTVSAATIGTLLKNGGYSFSFKPPANGSLAIAWYLVPKGAHITAAKPKPTLIARGNADFFSGRAGKITIRLTTAGKRLLRSAKTLKVTAKGTFTPILYAAVVTTRTFTLTR